MKDGKACWFWFFLIHGYVFMLDAIKVPVAGGWPERCLALAMGGLCLSLPLAHVRALQNTFSGLVALFLIVCLLRSRDNPFRGLPSSVLTAGASWLALSFASSIWSEWPRLSLSMAVSGVLMPFVLFLAGRRISGETGFYKITWGGALCGMGILAAVTLLLAASGRHDVLVRGLDDVLAMSPWARWFPGPGLTSSFVLLGCVLSFFAWHVLRWRSVSVVLAAALVIAGATSFNRMFWLALLMIFLVGFALILLRGPRVVWKLKHAVLLAVVLGGVTLCVLGSTAVRLQANLDGAVDLSRAGQQLGDDPRLVIWKFWLEAGRKHPWLGVGYGKETVRRTLVADLDAAATTTMDEAGLSHPHNLLLSIWMQLGAVGVSIFLVLLATILMQVWRAKSQDAAVALGMLVTALFVKNMTDDFYDAALPSLFWAYAGMLSSHFDWDKSKA